MIPLRLLSLVLAAALVGLGSHPGVAAETVKHSGTILAIDTDGGRFVLEEIGPWQVRGGVTQVIRREIVMTPATQFAIVVRANAPGGFAGDFVEGPLDPAAVEVGDLVTVECRHDGPRLVAIKITIADAGEP